MAVHLLFLLLCVNFGHQAAAVRDNSQHSNDSSRPRFYRGASWCHWGSWNSETNSGHGSVCLRVVRRRRQCCLNTGDRFRYELSHLRRRACKGRHMEEIKRHVPCPQALRVASNFVHLTWCPWGSWVSYVRALGYACRRQSIRLRKCACLNDEHNKTLHNSNRCPGSDKQVTSIRVSCYDPVKTQRLIFIAVGVSLITLTALAILMRIHCGAKIAAWYHHSGTAVYPSLPRSSALLEPSDDVITAPPSYDEVVGETALPSYDEALAQQLARGCNDGLVINNEASSSGTDNQAFNVI